MTQKVISRAEGERTGGIPVSASARQVEKGGGHTVWGGEGASILEQWAQACCGALYQQGNRPKLKRNHALEYMCDA
jgi:hypothetical protein